MTITGSSSTVVIPLRSARMLVRKFQFDRKDSAHCSVQESSGNGRASLFARQHFVTTVADGSIQQPNSSIPKEPVA